MLTPHEALDAIFARTWTLPAETVSLRSAAGRVLAAPVTAAIDLPPFDVSAMNGYAVRSADLSLAKEGQPIRLRLRDATASGDFSEPLAAGATVAVATGGAVPAGADAVVMQERAELGPDSSVLIRYAPTEGEFLRRKGLDVRAGDALLSAGHALRPYDIALLALQGVTTAAVVCRPQTTVLTTGDGLVEPGEPAAPGQIYNAYGPAVIAGLSRWGVSVEYTGLVGGDEAQLTHRLRDALGSVDCLIITGETPLGAKDFPRAALEALGVVTVFDRVAIKPGKLLYCGLYAPTTQAETKRTLVFGLPGNPVATLVCLEEFVRPALERLQGYAPRHPSYHLQGIVENAYRTRGARQQYLFCQVRQTAEGFSLHIIRPQGAAMPGMASRAQALAVAPADLAEITPGTPLAFRWLK